MHFNPALRIAKPLPTIIEMKILTIFLIVLNSNLIIGQSIVKSYSHSKSSETVTENTNVKSDRINSFIHQINLLDECKFEFRSLPSINCLTWSEYEGTYSIQNDSITFIDQYKLRNPDIELSSMTDFDSKSYIFNLIFDEKQNLQKRELMITAIYDIDSELKDESYLFKIDAKKNIEIPFESIKNLNELASFRITLNPNTSWRKETYHTLNGAVNIREGFLPNCIDIAFISEPKEETVTRITKGIINEKEILIISSESEYKLQNYKDLLSFSKYYINKSIE